MTLPGRRKQTQGHVCAPESGMGLLPSGRSAGRTRGLPMSECCVEGCQRPATAELRLLARVYPLCTRHAEILEDRILSLGRDERELEARVRPGEG
jgi:hypothetical protein